MKPTTISIADFPFRLVVAVSPHPDDSAVGCGGLLYRLSRLDQDSRPTLVTIVLASGHRGVTDEYLREYLVKTNYLAWPLDPKDAVRQKSLLREKEAQAEAKLLGIDSTVFLRLRELYERHTIFPVEVQQLSQTLHNLAASLPDPAPGLLLIPPIDDPHPVHSLASQLVIEAAMQIPGWTVWHYETTWMSLNPRDVTSIVSLTSDHIAAKLEALKQHRSQLARTDLLKIVRDMDEVKAQTLGEILFGFGKDGTELGDFVEVYQERRAVTLIL